MNEMALGTRQGLGDVFSRHLVGAAENWPQIGLATEKFRAIDLSCRACDACGAGAGCWAWIPEGGLRSAPVSTPNLQQDRTKNKQA